jgi:hypothetical protein
VFPLLPEQPSKNDTHAATTNVITMTRDPRFTRDGFVHWRGSGVADRSFDISL